MLGVWAGSRCAHGVEVGEIDEGEVVCSALRRRTRSNRRNVPPYRSSLATTCAPASTSSSTVEIAARPDANAHAVAPLSRSATQRSEGPARGVVRAAVVQALVHAGAALHVGRGGVDRRHDRAGRRVGRLPGVDHTRREALLGRRHGLVVVAFHRRAFRRWLSRSKRVIRPWKPLASATIATRPLSSTRRSAAMSAFGGSVCSARAHRAGAPARRSARRLRARAAAGRTRRPRRPARPLSSTGSCCMSASRMRWNVVSSVSCGPTLTTLPSFGAARDQVAQVAVAALLEQALVDHPGVVVDLAQVARAGVADEADHALGLLSARGSSAAPRPAACRWTSRRGMPSALSSSRAVAKLSSSGIEYACATADRSAIDGTKSSPMPSTAHEPGGPCLPVRDQVAQDRARRIGQHELQCRLHALEEARQAGQRAARSRRRPTMASRSWPHCCQISGPVEVSCASGLAGLLNWSAKNEPGISLGQPRRVVLVVARGGPCRRRCAWCAPRRPAPSGAAPSRWTSCRAPPAPRDSPWRAPPARGPRPVLPAVASIDGAAGAQAAVALGGLDHRSGRCGP